MGRAGYFSSPMLSPQQGDMKQPRRVSGNPGSPKLLHWEDRGHLQLYLRLKEMTRLKNSIEQFYIKRRVISRGQKEANGAEKAPAGTGAVRGFDNGPFSA